MLNFKFRTKPPAAEKSQAIIYKLEARLADARAELKNANDEYGGAVIAAEEDPTAANVAAAEKVRRAIEKAQHDVGAAETALTAAKVRHADALAAEAEQNTAAKWDVVDKHKANRLQAAIDAEKAAAQLWDSFSRMNVASAAIANECPILDPSQRQVVSDSGLFTTGSIAAVLRLQLLKAGFTWSAQWPWGSMDLPPLSQRIGEANAFLEKLRREGRV